MNKILDEIYITIEAEVEQHWIIRYSSRINIEQRGFAKIDKTTTSNTYPIFATGNALYHIIFQNPELQQGSMIALIPDRLFENGSKLEYDDFINTLRNKVISNTILDDAIKLDKCDK